VRGLKHGDVGIFEAVPGKRNDDGDGLGEEALRGEFAQPATGAAEAGSANSPSSVVSIL